MLKGCHLILSDITTSDKNVPFRHKNEKKTFLSDIDENNGDFQFEGHKKRQ